MLNEIINIININLINLFNFKKMLILFESFIYLKNEKDQLLEFEIII